MPLCTHKVPEKPLKRIPACCHCAFRHDTQFTIECRRYPPLPQHGFPIVHIDIFCGEYKEEQ